MASGRVFKVAREEIALCCGATLLRIGSITARTSALFHGYLGTVADKLADLPASARVDRHAG